MARITTKTSTAAKLATKPAAKKVMASKPAPISKAAPESKPVVEIKAKAATKAAPEAKTKKTAKAPSPAPEPVVQAAAPRARKAKAPEAMAAYVAPAGHNGGPPLDEVEVDEKQVEVIEAPGLGVWVGLDRMIKSLTALKSAREATLKPILADFFVEEAGKLPPDAKLEDVPKNFTAYDGPHVSAKASLRRKPAPPKGYDAKAQAVFRRHNIPLEREAVVFGVNSKYVGATAEPIWLALIKLIADNPKSGVPLDFVAQSVPNVIAPDDVIMRALRLGPNAAQEVLALVSTIAISDGEGSEETVKTLTEQIEGALAKATEAEPD